tara:strand:+ start:1637 stop:1765 length:129 start_codon:yes stop_codon:yes gene_type:complete
MDEQIIAILDKHSVDDFDNVLIKIMQIVAEQRKLRIEEEDDE